VSEQGRTDECCCGRVGRRGPLHKHHCPVFLDWSYRKSPPAGATENLRLSELDPEVRAETEQFMDATRARLRARDGQRRADEHRQAPKNDEVGLQECGHTDDEHPPRRYRRAPVGIVVPPENAEMLCRICGRELHHDARLGWLDIMGRTNCPDDPAYRRHTPERDKDPAPGLTSLDKVLTRFGFTREQLNAMPDPAEQPLAGSLPGVGSPDEAKRPSEERMERRRATWAARGIQRRYLRLLCGLVRR
jgi:hypothetical protein